MKTSDVHARALRRAAELLGGMAALAEKLAIPAPTVQLWLAEGVVPDEMLPRIVDIIIDR